MTPGYSLEGFGYAGGLDWIDRMHLTTACELRAYAPGEPLIVAGAPARHVLFTVTGLVQVTTHARPGEVAFLRACGPGHVLREDLLLAGSREWRRDIAVVAVTDCTAWAAAG